MSLTLCVLAVVFLMIAIHQTQSFPGLSKVLSEVNTHRVPLDESRGTDSSQFLIIIKSKVFSGLLDHNLKNLSPSAIFFLHKIIIIMLESICSKQKPQSKTASLK